MNAAGLIELVKSRFSASDEAIERAFEGSESFRALCWDYCACVFALACWQESESEEASLREADYSELTTSLMQEIEMWLRAMESTATSGSGAEGPEVASRIHP